MLSAFKCKTQNGGIPVKNVIIGQSGGPTAVINATLAGAYNEAVAQGADKVYGMIGGIQGLLNEKYADLSQYIIGDRECDILKQTPSAALGSCRYKLPNFEEEPQIYEKLFKILDKLEIFCVVYIGGNDSMDTIAKLSEYAKKIGSNIRFMGAPKTVDNDLAVTDHTPGFGSAAKYIAASVKEIICDSSVYDLKSVTVIEIMGRNAGWLTASAALAKDDDCCGVDLIYLPETAFDIEKCADKVKKLLAEKDTVVLAVSEALRDSNGEYIAAAGSVYAGLDAFGHKIMSGTGQFLANYLGKTLGVKARGIEISTLQRSAAHFASKQDINEAVATGAAAVKAAFNGRTAEMSVIRRIFDNSEYVYSVETADIKSIANIEKTVPSEWIVNDNTYVSDEFIKYARPLIMGEMNIIYKNGLPMHLKIK